uniref:Uncharacterized protein n=1 Tax=Romanomermis culicivorax TaxID=13658 RepID=A0A915JAH4_ROMCU
MKYKCVFFQGQVKFSAEGERIMWTQIEQLQNGEYKTIGYYHADTKEFRAEHEVIFDGGKIPQDDFKHVTTWKTVSTMLYAAMACLALLGALTAMSLILLNYKFSDRR